MKLKSVTFVSAVLGCSTNLDCQTSDFCLISPQSLPNGTKTVCAPRTLDCKMYPESCVNGLECDIQLNMCIRPRLAGIPSVSPVQSCSTNRDCKHQTKFMVCEYEICVLTEKDDVDAAGMTMILVAGLALWGLFGILWGFGGLLYFCFWVFKRKRSGRGKESGLPHPVQSSTKPIEI